MITPSVAASLLQSLKPDKYSIDPVELITYEIDAGFDSGTPDGVFFPESTQDVSTMMRWASRSGIPLIARGGGTGLAGGAVADKGGFVLSFARMNEIGTVDAIGRTVHVQAGAINLEVDSAVNRHGFYFPPDPSSQSTATIGGNIGTNAGGAHCFKYGVTTNYVSRIRAVLADGTVINFGGPALDSPEYDFCGLLVGCEGTLAVITEADLRVISRPAGVKTMMTAFDSVEQAGNAVSAVIAHGLTPATLEMMDQPAMRMISEYAPAGLPVDAGAVLIVEVDGHPESIDSQIEEVADLLAAHGGCDIRIAQTAAERDQIWYGRKNAAGAMARLSPRYYLTDVTVPRSYLGEILGEIASICQRHELQSVNVFHAGDGNLHPLIPCDESDTEMMARVRQAGKEIIQLCVDRDGSISGEHGIGIEKRNDMLTMCSANELNAMREIKEIFDPRNLLNPGKVFPSQIAPPEYESPTIPQSSFFSPESVADAAAYLAALTAAEHPVDITGAGVPRDPHGERPVLHTRDQPYQLSTNRFDKVIKLAPEDLFVTVGTGMRLSALHAELAGMKLQTALIASTLDATVGGLLAANVNSPQRIRYGSLRDNILATTVALADGRVLRVGRPVVKNVAGYDLPKLFVGSFGSLGVMTDVTLKLYPTPRCRQSLNVDCPSLDEAVRLARQLIPHIIICAGITVSRKLVGEHDTYRLVFTAEGVEEDVLAESELIRQLIADCSALQAQALPFGRATAEWGAFMADISPRSMIVRVGVPPNAMLSYIRSIDSVIEQGHTILVDPVSGFVYLKYEISSLAQARGHIDDLRRALTGSAGYAAVMLVPAEFSPDIDRWGRRAESHALMVRLRDRWDPAGILNAGIF